MSAPRIFALIIGINHYRDRNVKRLKAAVADANAIEDYLKKLGVPNSHITKLLDKEASRANIIQSFQDLEDNPSRKIRKEDAILIYYAGHGYKLAPASACWPLGRIDNCIESIVPHDYCRIVGSFVDIISDTTLRGLIEKIAKKWGDNITVIFDCCYSESGPHHNDLDILHCSAMLEKDSIPPDLDQEPLRALAVTQGAKPISFTEGQDSHIPFAACSFDELTREKCGRGQFTVALLMLLNGISLDKIKYEEVLAQLESVRGHFLRQNPQLKFTSSSCEGTLFNLANATHLSRNCYMILFDPNSGCYELAGGEAHGIKENAEFTVYRDVFSMSEGSELGVAIAELVKTFWSIMAVQSCLQLDGPAIAIRTNLGRQGGLKVYLERNNALYNDIQKQAIGDRGLSLVDRSAADLEIVLEGDKLTFDILEKDITNYGLRQLYGFVHPDPIDVTSFLWAAARYYSLLKRSQTDYPLDPLKHTLVDIQFFRLEYSSEYHPSGLELKFPVGSNLIENGVVILDIVNEREPYGIKIINSSDSSLYINVFYFDNSNLSIDHYLLSDVPLKPKGELTIGYGIEGGSAFNYSVPKGRDVDIGFLKFFLSTSPVDMSSIPQDSAFATVRRNHRMLKDPIIDNPVIGSLSTAIITLVQRRPKCLPRLSIIQQDGQRRYTAKPTNMPSVSPSHKFDAGRKSASGNVEES